MECVIFYIGLLSFLCLGSCANITLFISVKGQAGIPQIKKISGDPDSWTAVIKSTGNLDISTISGKPGVHLFGKLGAHPLASLLYCSNGQKQAIESINMKGSPAVRTRYSWTSLQIGGLAVDWISNNIYWTDQVYNSILMASVQDSAKGVLSIVDTELDTPGNVKVYPPYSYLFWTDYGKSPKIERSDLLGKQRTLIVRDVVKPVALEIDNNTQNIYWVDTARGVIARSDFNGQNIQTFIQNSFVSTLIGISIYQDHMFGISSVNKLYLMTISNASHFEARLNKRIQRSYDVAVLAEHPQAYEASPCKSAGCAEMCVGKEKNTIAECACLWGKHLVSHIKCSEYEDLTPPAYMLVQDGQICAYDARLPDVSASDINPECLEDVNGDVLAHDYQERNVFIGSGGSITKFHWPTMQSSVIFQGDSSISAITINWITKYLYWTNQNGDIMSANTKGSEVKPLLKSVQGLFGITVNPFTNMIYWTHQGRSPYIGQMRENGTDMINFVTRNLTKPGHLVFDFAENRLYFAEPRLNTIESVNENGTGWKTLSITNKMGSISGIALYQDYVVWLDQFGIAWSNKNGQDKSQGRRNVTNLGNTTILYGGYSQPFPQWIQGVTEAPPDTSSAESLSGVTEQPLDASSSESLSGVPGLLEHTSSDVLPSGVFVPILVAAVCLSVVVVFAVIAYRKLSCRLPECLKSEETRSRSTYQNRAIQYDTIEDMELASQNGEETQTIDNSRSQML